MTQRKQRAPSEWFNEAMAWYDQEHQGCVACGTRHCVFRSVWGTRVEYHCTACDFSTSYDSESKQYRAVQGEAPMRGALVGPDRLFEMRFTE